MAKAPTIKLQNMNKDLIEKNDPFTVHCNGKPNIKISNRNISMMRVMGKYAIKVA